MVSDGLAHLTLLLVGVSRLAADVVGDLRHGGKNNLTRAGDGDAPCAALPRDSFWVKSRAPRSGATPTRTTPRTTTSGRQGRSIAR
jgi:hypothetical protein